jgi:hypothetical protein
VRSEELRQLENHLDDCGCVDELDEREVRGQKSIEEPRSYEACCECIVLGGVVDLWVPLFEQECSMFEGSKVT